MNRNERRGCNPFSVIVKYFSEEPLGARMPLKFRHNHRLSKAQLRTLRSQYPGYWGFKAVPSGNSDTSDLFQLGYTKDDMLYNKPVSDFTVVHDISAREIPPFLHMLVDKNQE